MLDVDALAEAEGENWVWAGADVIEPDHTVALIARRAAARTPPWSANSICAPREFVDRRVHPARGQDPRRLDRRDRVYVGTDFGDGSLTTPDIRGCSRNGSAGRRWRPRDVFEGKADGRLRRRASEDRRPGFERDSCCAAPSTSSTTSSCAARGGDLVRIDVPDRRHLRCHREWLLISLRTDWTVADKT